MPACGCEAFQGVSEQPLISGCAGYNGIDRNTCSKYGCCFAPANATEGGTTLQLPACFYANGEASNYALQGGLTNGGGFTLSDCVSCSSPCLSELLPISCKVTACCFFIMV